MIALAVIAALILASAALAMSLRNLIHSALLLILTWAGIASFYLWAGAEFVAFAQLLIYVGAVSMVVLFAVLLTQRAPAQRFVRTTTSRQTIAAIFAGGSVAGVLMGAVMSTSLGERAPATDPEISVRQLGLQLMGPHAGSLLVVGLILTVALIGATILASTAHVGRGLPTPPEPTPPNPTTRSDASEPHAVSRRDQEIPPYTSGSSTPGSS